MKTSFSKWLLLPLMLLILSNFSCKDKSGEGVGNLEITYKLLYKGQPLSMFKNYAYPNGDSLYFTRFSMFISDLTLTSTAGNHLLEKIKYHNFTNSHVDLASASKGYLASFSEIPTGQYKGLVFGMGVPADDNAKLPSDFSSSNDLSNQAEYWGGWSSYIFVRTEGSIDPGNLGTFDTGISLHLGGDTAFQNIALDKSISIGDGQTTKVVVYIDIYNEFTGANGMYDIMANPQTHSLSQNPQVMELSQNLRNSFILE